MRWWCIWGPNYHIIIIICNLDKYIILQFCKSLRQQLGPDYHLISFICYLDKFYTESYIKIIFQKCKKAISPFFWDDDVFDESDVGPDYSCRGLLPLDASTVNNKHQITIFLSFVNVDKYLFTFERNTFYSSEKYILQFLEKHFTVRRITFCNLSGPFNNQWQYLNPYLWGSVAPRCIHCQKLPSQMEVAPPHNSLNS